MTPTAHVNTGSFASEQKVVLGSLTEERRLPAGLGDYLIEEVTHFLLVVPRREPARGERDGPDPLDQYRSVRDDQRPKLGAAPQVTWVAGLAGVRAVALVVTGASVMSP